MEKSCQSTGDSMSSINSNNNNTSSSNPRQNPPTDNFLKHLNKISHKISKPTIRRTPPLPNHHHHQNHHPHLPNHQQNPPTHISNHHQNPPTHISNHQNPPTHLLNHHHNPPTHLQNHQNQPTQVQNHQNQPTHVQNQPTHVQNQPTHVQNHQQQSLNQELQNQQQQQQQQPPVYNINKSDFRDVVQKLTGSPAHHDRFSTPPPIQPPKPPSSRLQRIRPPPLAHVSNRPPPPLTNHPYPSSNINPNNNFTINNINNTNVTGRQITPLSPLPPFPSVHGAAESPISAYMRYLQSSTPTLDSESKRFSGFSSAPPILSPKWNNHPNSLVPPPPQHQHHHHHHQNQQFLLPSPNSSSMLNSQFMMPNSPLGFGRVQSPRSPYPLLSPNLLFSPTSGQLGFPQFPPSPRLPMLSPRWRGL